MAATITSEFSGDPQGASEMVLGAKNFGAMGRGPENWVAFFVFLLHQPARRGWYWASPAHSFRQHWLLASPLEVRYTAARAGSMNSLIVQQDNVGLKQ